MSISVYSVTDRATRKPFLTNAGKPWPVADTHDDLRRVPAGGFEYLPDSLLCFQERCWHGVSRELVRVCHEHEEVDIAAQWRVRVEGGACRNHW